MTWRVAHSLDDLKAEADARWPGRSRVSDGTLGDAAHAARPSDHNPDAGGVVRARDITEDDNGTPDESDDVAEVIAETIRARRDPRVKYVIWRGRMFASYDKSHRKAWEWGPYTGPNGHFHHVHVSVLPGAEGDARGPWGIHPTTTAPPEDDMPLTDADVDRIALKAAAAVDAALKDDFRKVVESVNDTTAKNLRGVRDRILSAVGEAAGDQVDVAALAAALRDELGDAVADELAQRLAG